MPPKRNQVNYSTRAVTRAQFRLHSMPGRLRRLQAQRCGVAAACFSSPTAPRARGRLEVFATVVADNCDVEVQAACLWARLALVDVVANEMHCADERPAEREDLEVVRRRAIERGWYHRPTMAGITAHDPWGTRIVKARPSRVDQRTRLQALSSRRRRNPERDSRDQERQPNHLVLLPQKCRVQTSE